MTGKTLDDYAFEVLTRYEVAENGCWLWTGYILPTGYGQIGRNNLVHRLAYQFLVGPIAEGMSLDHLCHTNDLTCNLNNNCLHRRCVNPRHLEQVTTAVNIMRGRGFGPINDAKTHCDHGHEFTDDNIYYRPDRYGRMCRACRYEAGRRACEGQEERIAWQQRELRRTGVWPKRETWPGFTVGYQPRERVAS